MRYPEKATAHYARSDFSKSRFGGFLGTFFYPTTSEIIHEFEILLY